MNRYRKEITRYGSRFKKPASVILLVLIVLVYTGFALGSSGGGHGETKPKGWITTDTYRVMNFAALAIGLFLILRKPVSQALNGRIKDIEGQLNELKEKKKEAEEELAGYNEKLAGLEHEAEKLVEEYINQGNAARERILEEAKAAADKLEEQAKKNIDNEFKKAREELQADILEKALAKAGDIIKDKITSEDQEKLIDEYLEKVVA